MTVHGSPKCWNKSLDSHTQTITIIRETRLLTNINVVSWGFDLSRHLAVGNKMHRQCSLQTLDCCSERDRQHDRERDRQYMQKYRKLEAESESKTGSWVGTSKLSTFIQPSDFKDSAINFKTTIFLVAHHKHFLCSVQENPPLVPTTHFLSPPPCNVQKKALCSTACIYYLWCQNWPN